MSVSGLIHSNIMTCNFLVCSFAYRTSTTAVVDPNLEAEEL